MPHFFISYAKKDTRDLAIALSDALNALPDVTAWVDRSLKAGASWETQIQREINKCDYFVVLYSPDLNRHLEDESLEESYVLTEIAYAKYTVKKPIIPVMAQTTNPPLSLTTAHYIDFTLKGLSLDDLLGAICDEAGVSLQANVSIETLSIPSAAPKSTTKLSVKDLLPPPFDWCEIPAGAVTLSNTWDFNETYVGKHGKSKSFDVLPFLMATYPITNAQYAKFIEAGAYKNKNWWLEAGWAQKENEHWTEPRYWRESNWNGAEQPVVGVSWYEALAFCAWLSSETGDTISLPNEMQWQRAAQGDDGRVYPWGNNWDGDTCNNSVSPRSSKVTSSVRFYENKGNISPYGVVDMSGNVWEWCLTEYTTGSNKSIGTNARVLRGGSWLDSNAVDFSVVFRGWSTPDDKSLNWGFRIARSLD